MKQKKKWESKCRQKELWPLVWMWESEMLALLLGIRRETSQQQSFVFSGNHLFMKLRLSLLIASQVRISFNIKNKV